MRRGQVSMFVIVAIVIVAVIALFFVFRSNLFGDNIPSSLQPVYSRYSECISQETRNGISLLQSQGGRIDIGQLSYASEFNPFSSHLNFLGFKVPYWYGFSGNNLVIENVPTINEMESELADFISNRVMDCDFSDFYAQGFLIESNEGRVSVDITSNLVSVSVNSPLAVSLEEDSSVKNSHDINIDSNLGSLYEDALTIYNSERQNLFLENYALDVLQSYAPVDGVEIQCAPKVWKTQEVVDELQAGLEANIAAIRFDSSGDRYFAQSLGVNEEVNLIYLSEAFPSKVEITPASQALMIAEPVGTQEGLGVMGFCYVPYHFVYDLRFPVLVQVGNGIDSFQFPMVVNIDNNLVSAPGNSFVSEDFDVDVCSFAENGINVQTYDTNLNPIVANVSYRCFDSVCPVGETTLSGLDGLVPACVNGELIASAEGYVDSKLTFSSNSENFAEIILEKEYSVDVELRLGGQIVRGNTAVVHFVSEDYSKSAIIPESTNVELKEGLYRIEAFVYGNSNIVIPSSRKTECFTVSRGGIAGFFGSTKEECVSVEIPATKIDYALLGGGKLEDYYILGSELQTGKITIDVSELPTPNSLEQLQYNFEAFNTLGLEVNF